MRTVRRANHADGDSVRHDEPLGPLTIYDPASARCADATP